MIWAILIVVAVAGVAVFAATRRRPRRLAQGTQSWKAAISAAAESLSGRPALAGPGGELRAEANGSTVTAKVGPDLATADASLFPGAPQIRMYLATGIETVPEDLTYIPEAALPPAFGLDPPVLLRSDDADKAVQVAETSVLPLSGLKQAARADSLELLVRGDTLTVRLRGAEPSAEAVEHLIRTTAGLAHQFGGDPGDGPALIKQLPAKAEGPKKCTFCDGQRRPGVDWVECVRCESPYHAECWTTLRECSKPGCGSVESKPL